MANRRFVTVDDTYLFPTPLEARLAAKMTASVTDAAVAARVNGPQTGPAIDARISTQVEPVVGQLVAEAIADDQTLVEAAAAAVNANPTIAGKLDKVTFLGRHLGATEHLDTVKAVERFYVDTDGEASLALGFPIAKGGYGENRKWNDAGTVLVQTWHPFRYEGYFYRFFYSNAPYNAGGPGSGWMEFQTKTAIAALLAGKVDVAAVGPARSSMTGLVSTGDSLTAGFSNNAAWDAADAYPAKLAAELGAGFTVTNRGFSGATTDQINARMGALTLEVKIPSGSIPASGPVALTSKTVIGEWGGAISFNLYGYLAGIYGILSYTEASGYTFTRGVGGTAVAATRATFEGEFRAHATDTIIYGAGRNDITKRTTGMEPTVLAHIKRGYADIVEYMTPRKKQFVFLGTITRTDEAPGSVGFEEVKAVREWLADSYPANFLDLQGYLTGAKVWADTGITPAAADLEAQALGKTPPALFDDVTHYNRATAAAIAKDLIAPFLRAKGWV